MTSCCSVFVTDKVRTANSNSKGNFILSVSTTTTYNMLQDKATYVLAKFFKCGRCNQLLHWEHE